MPWKNLVTQEEISSLSSNSFAKPQCIFKHSTRCSISSTVKSRLEQGLSELEVHMDMYYLDLIQYRQVSNQVAEIFQVQHESPQVLLIYKGACIFEESHLGIQVSELIQQAKQTGE